jgi:hypothetical protein
MKKTHSLLISSTIILLSLAGVAYAAGTVPSPFSSFNDVLGGVFDIILNIFSLSFLKGSASNLVALMRFLIWLLLFAIFYTVAQLLPMNKAGSGNNRLPLIIALVISAISVIFMPSSLLIAIGEQYATVILVIMLLIFPIAGLYVGYVLIKPTNWVMHLLRLIILIVVWVILYEVDQGIANNFGLFIPLFLPGALGRRGAK